MSFPLAAPFLVEFLSWDDDKCVVSVHDRKRGRVLDAATSREALDEAYAGLRQFRKMQRLWRAGKLAACTIPLGEMQRMREEFFARGGKITKLPPGDARGAIESQHWGWRWDRYSRTVADKLNELAQAGRELEDLDIEAVVAAGADQPIVMVWEED